MATINAFIYYDESRLAKEGMAINNIPIALYREDTGEGIVAISNSLGCVTFENVPKGIYRLIETWGSLGDESIVDYSKAMKIPMPNAADPPLIVIKEPVKHIEKITSITPNTIIIKVTDDSSYYFYDGPVLEEIYKLEEGKDNNYLNKEKNYYKKHCIFNNVVDKSVANIGDILTYTITIANTSDEILKDLFFQNRLSYGLEFIYGSIAVNGVTKNFTNSTPNIGFKIPNIYWGEVCIINFNVKIINMEYGSSINSIATLTMEDNTSIISNCANTVLSKSLLLTINHIGDKLTAYSEDIINYTITINNPGKLTAKKVILREFLQKTEFISGVITISNSDKKYEIENPINGIYLPNIMANESVIVTLKVKVEHIKDTAIIKSYGIIFYDIWNEDNYKNIVNYSETSNVFQITIKPKATKDFTKSIEKEVANKKNTELIINKSLDKNIVTIGDELTYSITINNPSEGLATNLFLKDNISRWAEFINGSLIINGHSKGFEYLDPNKGFYISNIPSGGTVNIVFKAIAKNFLKGAIVLNTANITGIITLKSGERYTQNVNSNIVNAIIGDIYNNSLKNFIGSIALKESAVANILNLDEKQIQTIIDIPNISSDSLLEINKSIASTFISIGMLENLLINNVKTVKDKLLKN